MNTRKRMVVEGLVVFVERISGGDQEKVTSRDAGRGASEFVSRKRRSGDRKTEWGGRGRLI